MKNKEGLLHLSLMLCGFQNRMSKVHTQNYCPILLAQFLCGSSCCYKWGQWFQGEAYAGDILPEPSNLQGLQLWQNSPARLPWWHHSPAAPPGCNGEQHTPKESHRTWRCQLESAGLVKVSHLLETLSWNCCFSISQCSKQEPQCPDRTSTLQDHCCNLLQEETL